MQGIPTATAPQLGQDYLQLVAKKKILEAMLEDLKAQLQQREQPLYDSLHASGLQNLKFAGGTIYCKETVWAKRDKDAEPDDAKVTGSMKRRPYLRDFVRTTFHSGQVSSYYRERMKDADMTPAEFLDSKHARQLPAGLTLSAQYQVAHNGVKPHIILERDYEQEVRQLIDI